MNYIEKLWSIVKGRYKIIIAFFACSVAVFLIGYSNKPSIEKYYYDSRYYYQLSQTFIANGSFKFTNYALSFRGYLFPFILFLFTEIGELFHLNHSTSILIGNSMFFTYLFIIILPSFFPNNSKKYQLLRLFIPVILFMVYWQDLIYYPLSDLYSYGFIIIAMCLLKQIKFNHNIISLLQGILIGVFLYVAYNIRTIYLFTILIVILIYIISHLKENIRKTIFILCAITFGLIICSLPQSRINKKYYNVESPLVITDSFAESGLFNFQLFNGLSLQRYETYVGDPDDYPQPNLGFTDGVGNQLIANEQLDINFSILQYIKLAVKYPLDFMGIMSRHFLNIFHLPYNHVYIKDINYHKTFFTILNYTILFIAGIGLVTIIKKKKNTIKIGENMAYLVVTIIPCIAILPGAIEMRFFMPMYCLIYYFVAYVLSLNDTITYIGYNKIKTFLYYIFILAFLSAAWGSTFNAAYTVPQLLG